LLFDDLFIFTERRHKVQWVHRLFHWLRDIFKVFQIAEQDNLSSNAVAEYKDFKASDNYIRKYTSMNKNINYLKKCRRRHTKHR